MFLGWSSTLFHCTVLACEVLSCFVLPGGFDPLALMSLITHVEGIMGTLVGWSTFCIPELDVQGSELLEGTLVFTFLILGIEWFVNLALGIEQGITALSFAPKDLGHVALKHSNSSWDRLAWMQANLISLSSGLFMKSSSTISRRHSWLSLRYEKYV